MNIILEGSPDTGKRKAIMNKQILLIGHPERIKQFEDYIHLSQLLPPVGQEFHRISEPEHVPKHLRQSMIIVFWLPQHSKLKSSAAIADEVSRLLVSNFITHFSLSSFGT